MYANRVKKKGPWTHQVLVYSFDGLFALLFFWLLGFVIDDIGSWPGPNYEDIEARLLDPSLVQTSERLAKQMAETQRSIADQQSRQTVLSDSTQASQRTMNQLLEFQRLNLQKGGTPSEEEKRALADSQQLFLANQRQYQHLNEEIAKLNERLRDLQNEQRQHTERLEEARKPIQAEFELQSNRHAWRVAATKLAVLVPLLIVAVLLFLKMRGGTYALFAYAFGIAVALRAGLVMHEYFPTRYFKYVLILVALAVVVRVLVALLQMVAFPKKEWLLKQYREAYERFFCPMCEYPIRRGPLKYLFWSRRSIKRLAIPPGSPVDADAPYSCPMCGTKLFEECEVCHSIRHSLLPACQSCGAEKPA